MSPDGRSTGRRFGAMVLTDRIGRGTVGTVYRAFHEGLGRAVAVKIPHGQLSPSGRDRFLREADVSLSARHANLVQALEAGEVDGTPYLAMELVEGPSLARHLETGGPLAPETAAHLGAGVARGLAALHARGILHRDIKPENVLLGPDGVPRIADLGFARQGNSPELARLTATGLLVGTPLYLAPEAIRDARTATPASDVYSLGATIYHLLAGSPPFTSPSSFEVLRAHLDTPPPPLAERCPAALARLVERCLEKDPARRPTAAELAAELEAAATPPPPRRSPLGLAALAVALLAVIAAGVWLLS